MIGLTLLCSGAPGRDDGTIKCKNAADVRHANGRHWNRPLCGPCAIELEARLDAEGIRVAFVEIEARYSPPEVTPLGNLLDVMARSPRRPGEL